MANLGESVTNALLAAEPVRLDQMRTFIGSGLYAIYYTGSQFPYTELGAANEDGKFEVPIYVGKAEGKTRTGLTEARTRDLYERIRGHRTSIQQATNLDVEDFYVRWLVTEPIWIPLGESILIGRYVPVWNSILWGFGNNEPGGGRGKGLLSRWDTMHPGRGSISKTTRQFVLRSDKYPPRPESKEQIEHEVANYIRERLN